MTSEIGDLTLLAQEFAGHHAAARREFARRVGDGDIAVTPDMMRRIFVLVRENKKKDFKYEKTLPLLQILDAAVDCAPAVVTGDAALARELRGFLREIIHGDDYSLMSAHWARTIDRRLRPVAATPAAAFAAAPR